jgi:hypothetical protein
MSRSGYWRVAAVLGFVEFVPREDHCEAGFGWVGSLHVEGADWPVGEVEQVGKLWHRVFEIGENVPPN